MICIGNWCVGDNYAKAKNNNKTLVPKAYTNLLVGTKHNCICKTLFAFAFTAASTSSAVGLLLGQVLQLFFTAFDSFLHSTTLRSTMI